MHGLLGLSSYNVNTIHVYFNSAHADGGPHSRVYARETLCSAPINVSGNFPAHMSEESPSNISPNPSKVISEVSELFEILPLSA